MTRSHAMADLQSFAIEGRNRDAAGAILAQASHPNISTPIDDIQVRHLLAIGYRAGMARGLGATKGAQADVAGAVANLLRATDSTDPGYEGIRRAYGVALEAAGLVPKEGERQ